MKIGILTFHQADSYGAVLQAYALQQTIKKLGADFKQQYNFATYQDFFKNSGYPDAEYILVDGKMPCAIAIITKEENIEHE